MGKSDDLEDLAIALGILPHDEGGDAPDDEVISVGELDDAPDVDENEGND